MNPDLPERADGAKSDASTALRATEAFIGGRYRIEQRLGEGGGGVVFRAQDRDTGARVAIKTLQSMSGEQIALLKNEFRSVQGLQHPNIVQFGELFEADGQLFLSMEFVSGVDFLEYVRSLGGGFDEGRLRKALRQLVSAVAALHRARVVHRDIKPQNVLVTPEGRVVVLDLGLALHDERAATGGEQVSGTVLYMAPEQAAGDPVGAAADWYAVGVMLFRALTGAFPFDGPAMDVMSRKVIEAAPSPRSLFEGIPDDLASLAEDLLRTEPSDRPEGDAIAARVGATVIGAASIAPAAQAVSLLGRERELAWLEGAFRAAREGATVAAILKGESGVGKSLLLRTFVARLTAETPELLALSSRCYARESVPFKAFDGVAAGLATILEGLPEHVFAPWLSAHADLLPRIFPELGRVPCLSARASSSTVEDPQEARRHGFEALRQLLRGIASTRPVVLIIDDLQWADADSLALLRALLTPPDAPPLFLLCTQRVGTETASANLDAIANLPGDVRTLSLGTLDLPEARRFVRELLSAEGLPQLSEGEIDSIAREAGGHPMFLAEVVFQRKSRDDVGKHVRLDDALRARMTRLPGPAFRLLAVVCVAGIPMAEQVAADAAAIDGVEMMGALPSLCIARLVQTWGGGRATTVEPYHDRVRESVLASLSPEELASTHGRLATALEGAATSAEPEVLAVHWLESGERERAREYMMKAAEKATASLAFERAARFYAQALDGCASETLRTKLRFELADALTNAGRWGEAATLRLELAKDVDALRGLELKTRAAEQLLCSGRFTEGVTVLEQVLKTVRVYVPTSPLLTLLSLLYVRLILRQRGLDYTLRREASPERAVRIDPLISAGAGFAMTDNAMGAYFNSRALLRSLRAGDPDRLVRALGNEVAFASSAGPKSAKQSFAVLGRLLSLAREVDTPFAQAIARWMTGSYHYFAQHDWVGAKREFRAADQMFGEQCVGQFWTRSTARTLACRVMVYLGDRDELATYVARAIEEAEQIGDLYGLTNLWSGPLAWLRLTEDQPELSVPELERVAELLPKRRFLMQTYFHLYAVEQLDLYRGSAESAFERMEKTWRALRFSLLFRVQAIWLMSNDLRGRAALAAAAMSTGKERERRLRVVVTATRRLDQYSHPCSDGFAALLRAGVCALRSQPEDGAKMAETAAVAFETCSMKLHVAASRWVQGACTPGESGAQMRAAARQTMADAGIRRPERFAAMLAPGVPL